MHAKLLNKCSHSSEFLCDFTISNGSLCYRENLNSLFLHKESLERPDLYAYFFEVSLTADTLIPNFSHFHVIFVSVFYTIITIDIDKG